ncbi:nucleotidyltransferase substrate binding protein [Candidatus Peregrinibacteria bacterium]|nr:MAG: nucleotidyltransferase substrate binding protein [Candidatus Peregrinibacteria bacterium]
MNKKSIRWQQRYENYIRALKQLEEAAEIIQPSPVEQAGLIQFFEMTFELAWKTLKDHLESKGQLLVSPRDVLKQAFQNGLIQDGEQWLKALQSRNLTAHLYDEKKALELFSEIKTNYLPILIDLRNHLKNEL